MNQMRYNGLGIHIKVADIAKSRDFYEGLLDLKPVFGYGDTDFRRSLPDTIPSVLNDGLPGAPERYRGVTYEPTPQSPLEIADGHIAVPDRSVFTSPVPSPKVSAMLRVESLVPVIVGKGLRPSFPVRHYYWGTVEAAVKDPDGFVLILIAPHSDAEVSALREVVDVEVVTPAQ
jgi:catechol 2,3-dioxygenase-like lactoylglutathione lyase family enzyme